jgi:hypothetical protein
VKKRYITTKFQETKVYSVIELTEHIFYGLKDSKI